MPTHNNLMIVRDRRWIWLGHKCQASVEIRLICVQPTKEAIYGECPDVHVRKLSKLLKAEQLEEA